MRRSVKAFRSHRAWAEAVVVAGFVHCAVGEWLDRWHRFTVADIEETAVNVLRDCGLDRDHDVIVRDLHPSLDGNAIEAMARWIHGEIKAARRLG